MLDRYRTNWLNGALPADDPGRPPLPVQPLARLIDLADQPLDNGQFTALTSTSSAALLVDGKNLGVQHGAPGKPYTWPAPARTSCSFPSPLNNTQCHGLQPSAGVTSAIACKAACCAAPQCSVWQFSTEHGCWIGDVAHSTCTPPDDGDKSWVGGGSFMANFRNATVVALNDNGAAVARHELLQPGKPVALVVMLDVPSAATGTGSSLVLDGTDVALVRVFVADADGVLVTTSDVNVTFTVQSGPGRVLGVGNGDPASHTQPHSSVVNTYFGLARGVVQVTADCTTPNRKLAVAMDVDGNMRTKVEPGACTSLGSIVVAASAPGLSDASVTIPTSTDLTVHSPVAVARANVNLTTWTYTEDFQG